MEEMRQQRGEDNLEDTCSVRGGNLESISFVQTFSEIHGENKYK